jgi:hypothetical protein
MNDLIDAHELCIAAGVIRVIDGTVSLSNHLKSLEQGWMRRLAILDQLWLAEPPAWLSSLSFPQLLVMMPENDREVLEWTEADVIEREAFLLGMARKADAQRLADVGRVAEEYVMERYHSLLEANGGGSCERVSLISDQLGYDLVVSTLRGSIRVEVKAAAGVSLLRVFLSRNEAEVAGRTATWRMVFCVGVPPRDETRIAGHLVPSDLSGRLPLDPRGSSRWETCRLIVPTSRLRPELPLP